MIHSSTGYYYALDKRSNCLIIFDDEGTGQTSISTPGSFSSISGIPYLAPFPKSSDKILIRFHSDTVGVLSLEDKDFICQHKSDNYIKSAVCCGKGTIILLEEKKTSYFDYHRHRPSELDQESSEKFKMQFAHLKGKEFSYNSYNFSMVNSREGETPKFLTLGPNEKHLLVSTMKNHWGKIGWIYIFRLSSDYKPTYLSCVDFSESGFGMFGSLNFHGYKKTKLILSGFTLGSESKLYTVVYDFESKKVVLVRNLRTKISSVRNLSLLGSSLYGVDDYCKKFELRI